MLQDHVTSSQINMRSRPRFRLRSRAYLAYGMALSEGTLAAILALAGAQLFTQSSPWAMAFGHVVTALAIGILYAVQAISPASRWLAASGDAPPRLLDATRSWIVSLSLIWLASAIASGEFVQPQAATWVWLLGSTFAMVAARYALYGQASTMMQQGQWQIERTALIGSVTALRQFERNSKIWQQGRQVITRHVVGQDGRPDLKDFAARCAAQNCDHALFVGDMGDAQATAAAIEAFRPYAIDVAFAPMAEHDAAHAKLIDILPLGPANAVRMARKPLTDGDLLAKRLLDIVGAGFGLLLISPLMLAVAIAVRTTSPGPALYRQERKGFNGRSFYIYKFRSMRVMEDGRAMRSASVGDDRITRLGHFLRRTSIDELPQLLNVLRGDMSLVGPRPHAISHDVELSNRFALYAHRQRIKPGITGWAQVNGHRGEITTDDQLEQRTLHDLHYVENWTLLLDIKTLWLTVFSRKVHSNAR